MRIFFHLSPYLKSFFAQRLLLESDKHNSSPILILIGVRADDLRRIIEFIYTGSLEVEMENYMKFRKLAEELQIKGFSDHSIDTIPDPKSSLPVEESNANVLQSMQSPNPPVPTSANAIGKSRRYTTCAATAASAANAQCIEGKEKSQLKPVNGMCRYCSSVSIDQC